MDDHVTRSSRNHPESASAVTRSTFDWRRTPPVTAVVETVATASDREPTDMPVLNETVDADALEALMKRNGAAAVTGDLRVTFRYAEHRVVIGQIGTVKVAPE